MRKGILVKAILFVVVFAITAFFVNKLYYRGFENENYQRTNTTLPVVYVRYQEEMINRMLAYKTKINTSLERTVVMPVAEDKKVTILLPNDSDYTKDVSYELRSFDGESLIEDGELENPSRYNGFIQYDITFRMELTLNKEYQMVIKLSDGKETLRYYSRVVRLERDFLQGYLDYIKAFNTASFDEKYDDNGELIEGYAINDESLILSELEGKETDNTSDLGKANLNSSYDIITFGNLKPERTSELIPVIKEIGENECTLQYQYTVSSGRGENVKNYIVDEYYEMSYDNSSATTKLLNYKRNMDYVFNYKDVNTILNSLAMGVCSDASEKYIATEDGKRAAFITENQLWFYDYKNTSMSNIYGFWKGTMADIQEVQNRTGFNLLSINDEGIVCFVVYGRIPRGTHEGENGILLYEYSEETGELKELLFIETEMTYDVMTGEVGSFAYFNRSSKLFYTILDNSLVKIDTQTRELSYITDNMPVEKIFYSSDHTAVAFVNDSRPEKADGIIIVDCQNDKELKIPSKYEISEVIGFVGTDIVYGDGNISDLHLVQDGTRELKLKELNIIAIDGTNKKSYSKDNRLIKGVEIGANVINFELTDNENVLARDYISFKHEETGAKLTFKNTYSEDGYACLNMVFPSNVYIRKIPKLMLAKVKKESESEAIVVSKNSENNMLYVFSYEGLCYETVTASKAMEYIANNGGVLLNGNGEILYKTKPYNSYLSVAGRFSYQQCGNRSESLNACAYMSILASGGKADYGEILGKESFEDCFDKVDTAVPINLYGTDIDTALLFLSDGIPFTARLSDGRYVLVVSYNNTAIRYYDPVDGMEVKVTKTKFVNDVNVYGNVIYAFAKK